jgi:hypothetical protein
MNESRADRSDEKFAIAFAHGKDDQHRSSGGIRADRNQPSL